VDKPEKDGFKGKNLSRWEPPRFHMITISLISLIIGEKRRKIKMFE
jgi:hypothetical protein